MEDAMQLSTGKHALTRAEIMQMDASQLRLAVAEMMEPKPPAHDLDTLRSMFGGNWRYNYCDMISNGCWWKIEIGLDALNPNWKPCVDTEEEIVSAWAVLESVVEQWKWYEIAWRPGGKHHVNLTGNGSDSVVDSPLPMAIYRAALLARCAE